LSNIDEFQQEFTRTILKKNYDKRVIDHTLINNAAALTTW